MAASSAPKGDPTESTVSIHDEEAVLRNLFTALHGLFVSCSGGGSGLLTSIKSSNLRFKTSRAINDGVDKSIKSLVIPLELAAGLDPLFGLAKGAPRRLVLRAGSGPGEPHAYAGSDIISIMVISSKVMESRNWETGEVTNIPTDDESVETVAWISESDIELPVGGGCEGVLNALQATVSEARQFVHILPELGRSDDFTDDELEQVKRDLGR